MSCDFVEKEMVVFFNYTWIRGFEASGFGGG